MARYNVYSVSPGGIFVIDVQAELLDNLGTRVVVPLLLKSEISTPLKDLNPTFDIAGNQYVMVTQAIASIPVKSLRTLITSLREHQDVIVRALDMLLSGY